jgi:hypothetical protein
MAPLSVHKFQRRVVHAAADLRHGLVDALAQAAVGADAASHHQR